MSSEETPLLSNQHNLIYERFAPQKKRALVVIVSWAGLVAFLTSGTFVPSIPQIARDLNITEETVSVAVSINILASAIGGLVGSKYAKFYGRRPAFLWCLPVMIAGSLGVATAQNVAQLMAWRFVQGMGGSPGLSVGAAVIGDIYKLEERGIALGSYFGAGILGLSLAPVIGGITAYYFSWRAIHYGLAAFTLGAFFCILLSFPETSHPGTMGIDKFKSLGKVHPKWRPVILNPFGPLTYLRSPNILAVAIAGFLFVLTDFALLLPFSSTIGRRYGIENEAIIGACLLPLGIGGAVGAPLSGWVSDKVVAKYRRERGYWYPEDRLRASLFGFFLPVAVFAPAVITKYVPGTLGLVLNLFCFLINGVAIDVALTPCGTYIVDILPSNSAEVTAAVGVFRSLLFSVSTAMLLPMINNYGYILTSSIVSLLAFSSFWLLYLTILFGESMRRYVDVGFATADGN